MSEEQQNTLREKAAALASEAKLEVVINDEAPIIPSSDEDEQGNYVQAWIWVPA